MTLKERLKKAVDRYYQTLYIETPVMGLHWQVNHRGVAYTFPLECRLQARNMASMFNVKVELIKT